MTRQREPRELAAELALLERYDALRAGHDYGGGQRRAELGRRRRELERIDPLGELEPVTAAELGAAWLRVGRRRAERIKRENARFRFGPEGSRGMTPSGRRGLEAWARVAAWVARELERAYPCADCGAPAGTPCRPEYGCETYKDRRPAEPAGRE